MAQIFFAQRPHLPAPDLVVPCGLLFIVHTKAGEKPSYSRDFESCCLRSQDKIPVQRILKIDIHRSDFVPHPAAPEHRFLGNVARVMQRLVVVRRQDGSTDFQSLVINKNTVAIDNVDVRPRIKEIGNKRKCSRKQRIVTVEIRHNVAIGFREAGVDGIRLPVVRCAAPTDFVAVAL